ncbi:hypothetical protein ACE3MZ_21440 [Paenibacillus sp. WLX1005]|uniref:hypothetical protein n=1 Tax=Paenibacillus sp. WLX1005 TaxID=3243766 RepID=UPI003983F11F
MRFIIMRAITCLVVIGLAVRTVLSNPSDPNNIFAYMLMVVAVLAFVLPLLIQKIIRRVLANRRTRK